MRRLAAKSYVIRHAVRTRSNRNSNNPIDAFAPAIPEAVLDSARTLGALTERDTVLYVFAPNGHGMKDALVVTPEALVVVGGGTPRRYAHSDYVLVVARTNRRGLIILRLPNDARDTVYHSITGIEQQVLELGMRRALPR